MLLHENQTHIAYRCPQCGEPVWGFVGNFALSADMLRLKCPCGKSELSITYTGAAKDSTERKIRLTVPCLFCGKPHSFVVSQSVFFGQDRFLLNCPYTNMDICFLGSEQQVEDALKTSAEEINRLLSAIGISSVEQLRQATAQDEEELLPDAQIYDILRFVFRELQEDGGIDCPCHGGEYEFEVIQDGIRVYCPACGAQYIFATDSLAAAQEFLHCDHIELK